MNTEFLALCLIRCAAYECYNISSNFLILICEVGNTTQLHSVVVSVHTYPIAFSTETDTW